MIKYPAQRGFVPLIILLLAGVVVATGGFLVVREQFIKNRALDEDKIQRQIDKPLNLGPEPKVTDISKTSAGVAFTYVPKDPATEPKFTINPPSGWSKGDTGKFTSDVRVYFETERDREDLTPPLFYLFPPQITVLFIKSDEVKTLSQAVEARLDASRKQGDIISSSRSVKINGMDAWALEFTWREKTDNVLLHQLEYIFLPIEGVMVMADGIALDSFWSDRESQIRSSLNSITF